MTAGQIVIVGGGVIGSSIAYHLIRDGHPGPVVVVERDATYARASSFLAMGGIRQQFTRPPTSGSRSTARGSTPRSTATCACPGTPPAPTSGSAATSSSSTTRGRTASRRRLDRQRRLGARVRRLERDDIRALAPDLRLDDIRFGVFGPDDGYGEPREVLAGFRAAAADAGARYVAAEVVDLTRRGDRVAGVVLNDGEKLAADVVVNAAGPFARRVAAMAGLDLPVEPVRQHLFRCALPARLPYRLPMIVDPSGVHWRHDDTGDRPGPDRLVVACTKLDEPPGENFACDDARWESDFRPPLQARMPGLAPIELIEGWAGLYAMTPDHNPLLGEHPAAPGLVLANGYSGHGLMIAPAVGKVLSELIRLGRTETADVSCFAPDRFERGEPVHDEAMV